MPRFVILEHTGAPDDPSGRHFDLLIEAGAACRTWRLASLPEPGGQSVMASELPPHRLAWLDHEAGEVSGGRGFARRVASGMCHVLAGDRARENQAEDLVLDGVIAGHLLRLARSSGAWVAMVDR
jgi:hypothetical protein